MNIIIRNTGDAPIYDQITQQVKGLILRGELREGEGLPSVRLSNTGGRHAQAASQVDRREP